MRLKKMVLTISGVLTVCHGLLAQSSTTNDGAFLFDARLRKELVDDASINKNADANTLRLRFGYRTPVNNGWRALIELENTQHIGGEKFNSTANGLSRYPVVADPDNSELNQAYVQYAPSDTSRLIIGRQRLQIDNQRFFGNSGWRQNEQTFDAVDGQHKFANGLTLRYDYLGRVQRVFGDDNPNRNLARWDLNAHLLNANFGFKNGALVGYGHFIDNQSLPTTSHRNLGLRYTGKGQINDRLAWLAGAEFAKQDDYAHGSANIDAHYALLEGGFALRGHTVKAGFEQLSGNGRYGFATPFATLHAFNGWADRFLTTPVDGLQDSYVGWSHPWQKFTANAAWHEFDAQRGTARYGHELDASFSWAFAPHWNALIKFANFRAKAYAGNLDKTWFSLEYIY
jgi:hypothetical protein